MGEPPLSDVRAIDFENAFADRKRAVVPDYMHVVEIV